MDYVKVNLDNAIATLAKLGAPSARFGEIMAGITFIYSEDSPGMALAELGRVIGEMKAKGLSEELTGIAEGFYKGLEQLRAMKEL